MGELLDEAGQVCRVDGDDLIIEHCYIERRLRPLNLYLQEVNEPAARQAVVDTGRPSRISRAATCFQGTCC